LVCIRLDHTSLHITNIDTVIVCCIDWLVKNARLSDPTDMRPIIFMSHHQYFSAWEKGYDSTPKQLAALLPKDRVPLWLWGHEHRLSFYDKVAHGT
jgi:hypothetical protein